MPHEDARWILGSNYPEGVDPFGFGLELELELRAGKLSVTTLEQRGVSPADARAAMASLHLTRMLIPQPIEREPSAPTSVDHPAFEELELAPNDPPTIEAAAPPESAAEASPTPSRPHASAGVEDSEGLVVHKRSGGMVPLARPPEVTQAADAHAGGDSSVEQRLGPWEDKTYFRILRVGPETDDGQLERSYRFLARKVVSESAGGHDAGARALHGLLREAWIYLRDPARRARYAAANEQERRELEADPKVERAVRALGEGRDEEGAVPDRVGGSPRPEAT